MRKIVSAVERTHIGALMARALNRDVFGEDPLLRVARLYTPELNMFTRSTVPVLRFLAMGQVPSEIPAFSFIYAGMYSKEFKIEGYDPEYNARISNQHLPFQEFMNICKDTGIKVDLNDCAIQGDDLILSPLNHAHVTLIRRFNFYEGRFKSYMNLIRNAVETSDNVITTFYDTDVANFFSILSMNTNLKEYKGGISVVNLMNYTFQKHGIRATIKALNYDTTRGRSVTDDSLSFLISPTRLNTDGSACKILGGIHDMERHLLDAEVRGKLTSVTQSNARQPHAVLASKRSYFRDWVWNMWSCCDSKKVVPEYYATDESEHHDFLDRETFSTRDLTDFQVPLVDLTLRSDQTKDSSRLPERNV